MSYDLREFKVWIKAREFRREVSKVARKFPPEERYLLVQQLLRSSRSVSANIAEGHGRFHRQENIQFCRIARGSLSESYDHLTVALDEGYVDMERITNFEAQIDELHRMINAYISFLERKKET